MRAFKVSLTLESLRETLFLRLSELPNTICYFNGGFYRGNSSHFYIVLHETKKHRKKMRHMPTSVFWETPETELKIQNLITI